MKRILIVTFILFSLVFSSIPVTASTQSEVSSQYTQIENLKKEIQTLDSQISQYENQINSLNSQISQTSAELLQAQQEEAALKEANEGRIRAAYMYGSSGYSNYLYSAESPSDFISFFDIVKEILKADKDTANELKAKREQIQTLQTKLTTDRSNLVNAKNQAESSRAQKQSTLESNQSLVAQLESELGTQTTTTTTVTTQQVVPVAQSLQDSVAIETSVPIVIEQATSESNLIPTIITTDEDTDTSYEDNSASSAMTLPRFISQQAGYDTYTNTDNGIFNSYMVAIPNLAGSTITVAAGELASTWYWPLDTNDPNAFTITSNMGYRESPGGIGSTNHGGIDIGASYGTAIVAAQSGYVNISGVYDGYGNAVQIDHGNGYETLYGHMSSIAVSKGEYVTAGQVIGFVGSTGWSTGPHLHYEVHVYNGNGQMTKVNGLSFYGSNIHNRLIFTS